MKFFKAVSIYHNAIKLFTVEANPNAENNFSFFNGIRVLMICWVIYGHEFFVRIMSISNYTDENQIFANVGWPTLVPAAYFAVDVFFWMGAFLATYFMLEKFQK